MNNSMIFQTIVLNFSEFFKLRKNFRYYLW